MLLLTQTLGRAFAVAAQERVRVLSTHCPWCRAEYGSNRCRCEQPCESTHCPLREDALHDSDRAFSELAPRTPVPVFK